MIDKPFKPNIRWLRRVEKCDVYSWFRYSARTGGRNGFRGGMVAYLKHLGAGFVNRAPVE